MKRFSLFVSILIVASLALAACGPAANDNLATPLPGDDVTVPTAVVDPVLEPTEIVPMPTDTVDLVVEPTATVAVVEDPAATATVDTTGAVDDTDAMVEADRPYRLSTLFDADVKTLDDEDMGEIERLVVNADGTIRYAVLKTGEFLGMGGRSIFVPWQAFQVFANQDDALIGDHDLVLNTTEDALTGAPEVDMDNLDYTVADWDDETMAYWNTQNLSVPVTGADTAPGQPAIVFNSGFDDIDVVNTADEELGEVEDFIVDPITGTIQYAVFDMSGWRDADGRFVAIPFETLNWVQHDDDGELELLFNVDQEQFNTAPAFEDWDEVDLTTDNFDAEWRSFWQGVDNTITP